MLSFSKIITLSAVAFGTLTQALPILQGNADINARNSDLVARCNGGCPTLDGVFVDLEAELDVKLGAISMKSLPSGTCVALTSRQSDSQRKP